MTSSARGQTLVTVTFGLLLLLGAVSVRAQVSPISSNDEPGATQASTELAELQATRQELRDRLSDWRAQASEYVRVGQQAAARIEAIEQEIALLENRDAIVVPDDVTPAKLDAMLLDAEQDLAAARRESVELDMQADQRSERRRRVPELLSVAKQRLNQLESAPSPKGGDPLITSMQAEVDALRREVRRAEIEAYQSELASYDARGALLSKQRDRTTLRIAYYGALTSKLREARQRLSRLQVERENESTKKLLEELTGVPPDYKRTLEEVYRRNEALASVWTSDGGLSDQITDVSEKLARAESKVASIQSELTRLAARVDAVGLADSVGALLRRHRAEAPDIGMYSRFIRMRQEQIGAVQLQQIKLREQREALADIDALVAEVMDSVPTPISKSDRTDVEELLRQLFETQRRYMDALIERYETYFQKLVDFDAQQQELIARTRDLLAFIDERILWVPSGRAVQPDLLSDGRDAFVWLTAPKYLAQLGRGLRDAATRWWPLHFLALLLLLAYIPVVRRIRPRLEGLGTEARRKDCTRFAPTAEAFGLSVLNAIWLPALLAYFGWRLELSPSATQYTRSIAYGLVMAAVFWATLRVPRQLLRPRGVADAHCEWSENATRALFRHLGWFAWVTVPAVFMIAVFEMRGEDLWRESVGRVLFLIALVAVLVFNYFTLRPNGALSQMLSARIRTRPWTWRVVQVTALGLPLAFGVAALRGFYWTVLQFSVRLHFTLLFLFLLVVFMQLAARLSMLGERRAALEPAALEDKVHRPAPTMEISRLMLGTGLLLAILGAFAIWADLLPAVRILDQVELWTSTQTVTVTDLDPSGVERRTTEERLVAVTLADLFRALLIGLLSLALVRALPGVLEATVFRRLGPGERYAYVTIVKYAVVLVGLGLAFDAIGVGWSSIQWLVAAVGLGLGFGLQEIFANFVSGLIILFERPIRVGDTVSVGEINGTVSRIRTRATWITGFDRKELIVPNKTFVTGQLINWTLSDPVLRLEIPVGIAYGSDTDRAIEVLSKVAKDSVRVLHDPPPQVFFLSFGDSSLDFELRVFTRGVNQRFLARHELHMSIDKAFREAGIEIAFPQRDLHVRSLPKGLPPTPAQPQ
ncbi:MAG: mechanosensitive ion channel domain-containing protein [Polyangiales bacterium]